MNITAQYSTLTLRHLDPRAKMSDGSSQLLRVLGSALIRCVPFCHPVVTSQDSQGVPRAKWSRYKIAPELNIQRLQNARDPRMERYQSDAARPRQHCHEFVFTYTEFKIGRQMDPSASLLSWSILFAPASGSGLT